jgi:hypothetical protein
MFLPGFFTGSLIQRIGERATIAFGIVVNAASLAVGFTGTTVWHFWLTLLLVGVGWNLMFVGGSTLVTRTYSPAERTKAQAANDFLIWTTVAVTSLSSGQLLHRHGWRSILVTAGPLLALAAAAIITAAIGARAATPAARGLSRLRSTIQPVVPGSLRRLGGQGAAPLARLLLQTGQRDVPGVLAEPPRVTGANQFLVQATAVRKDDLAEQPPVPVSPAGQHGDRAIEREIRSEPAGTINVRLPLLWRVDSHQANDFGPVVMEHLDRVSVGHADDAALELPGRGRIDEQGRQDEPEGCPAEGTPARPVSRFHRMSVRLRIRTVSL